MRQTDVMRSTILCITSLIVASCGTPNETPDTGPRLDAFENQIVTITADAAKAVRNRPITITTRCLPKRTGKGWMSLSAGAFNDQSRMIVESPVDDTLFSHQDDTLQLFVRAEFTANQPFEQKWRVHLPDGSAYVFDSAVWMDSVYIADSARMYHVNSEVARQNQQVNVGYTYTGLTPHQFFLYP